MNDLWYKDLCIISVLLAAKVTSLATFMFVVQPSHCVLQFGRLFSQRASVKSDESPTWSSDSACASDRLGLMFAGAEKNGRSHGNHAEEAQRGGRRPACHSWSAAKGTEVLTHNVNIFYLEGKHCFKTSTRSAQLRFSCTENVADKKKRGFQIF